MIKKLKPHKCNWEGKVNDEKTGKKISKGNQNEKGISEASHCSYQSH